MSQPEDKDAKLRKAGKAILASTYEHLKKHGLGREDAREALQAALEYVAAHLDGKISPSASAHGGEGESAAHSQLPMEVVAKGGTVESYTGCLLGLALGDAVGVASYGHQVESLGELNRALGAQRPPVDEHLITASGPLALQLPGGQFGLPLGCWSDRTAAAMCTAQSMVAVGRHDPVDVLLRLLRLYRTGVGGCRPGMCPGLDAPTIESLEAFERYASQGGKRIYGRTAPAIDSSAALARVPPIVLLMAPSAPAACLAAAAENTRTTHNSTATMDASRYLAAVLAGIVVSAGRTPPAQIKELVLASRYAPAPDVWGSKPLSRDARDIADGSFRTKECPRVLRDSASEVLAQALWALLEASSFEHGIERLLQHRAGRAALSVYGALAGALFGAASLPKAWIQRVRNKEQLSNLAASLLDAAHAPPPAPPAAVPPLASPISDSAGG
ncbi:ADP-ribosylation/Crystallin J1 [Baffinella frigidus]|nr:ADP-ribosylation/Crystallin J1 [Cryptophyta sp. CCMP2293]